MFDVSSEMDNAYELLKQVVYADWEGDPHLVDTPRRFIEMLGQLTWRSEFKFTTFASDSDEMVVVQNIPFYTFCAHHILPFFGKAHVAYIPEGKIAGLSKLARTVDYFSHGLNVQEELTQQIANFLEGKLDPLGVAVIMEAEHLCMTMRGVQKPGAVTTTSALIGAFKDKPAARAEFMSIVRH